MFVLGSGGSTSGKAFCLGRPGSNPVMDLGFFQFRFAVSIFSLGVGLFNKARLKRKRMAHALPSVSFPAIFHHLPLENVLFVT